jgi:hypothetical protein
VHHKALGGLLARIIGAELHVCEVLEQHERIGILYKRLWEPKMFAEPELEFIRSGVREASQLSEAAAQIGLRHYTEAHDRLSTFLKNSPPQLNLPTGLKRVAWPVGDPAPLLPNWSPDDEARSWIQNSHLHASNETRRLRVQAVRRMVYLYMHVAYAEYLSSYQSENKARRLERQEPKLLCRERSRVVLQWAEHYCCFGLGILRGVMPEDDAFVYRENARLRSHLALIKARLARQLLPRNPTGAAGLLREAEVHLVDAEAFVEEFPIEADRLTKAVIELRRAEVMLIDVGTRSPIREIRSHIRKLLGKEEQIPRIPVPEPNGLVGRLEDATRALRRAERCLREHPNSIWWREILLVLKLKAYEYVCAYDLLRIETGTVTSEVKLVLERDLFRGMSLDVRSSLRAFRRDDVFHLARATDAVARTYWTILQILERQKYRNYRYQTLAKEADEQAECLRRLRDKLEQALEMAAAVDQRIIDYAKDTILDTHDFELWRGRVIVAS